MGSAIAATVMDLLGAIGPKAVLFLGKCGGVKKKNQLGDFILPIAAIRGEGTSNDYLPPEVPALPSFRLQKAVSTMIATTATTTGPAPSTPPTAASGSTTRRSRNTCGAPACMAIDMETATIFIVGFVNQIPSGALLLVSDNPMTPEGVKTELSDRSITSQFVEAHIKIGIEALKLVRRNGRSVKHLRFEGEVEAD